MPKYEIRATSRLDFCFQVEATDEDAAESEALEYLENNGSSMTDILGEDRFEIDDVCEVVKTDA